ncbi:methylated-DNA--[protein]-cysteine S-methyltransferase [bacterium AH-315-B15]|nr:methylated-DNA--[protein]-cysteine S-methyltransferase [bacterium AH-315-B15]
MTLHQAEFNTPIGPMIGLASEEGLHLLEFKSREQLDSEIDELKEYYQAEILDSSNDHLQTLDVQLRQYFNQDRQKFSIPLQMSGSKFQLKVWGELLLIPYAETRTYREQAMSYGDEKAIRAVATANGKNKIAILVPCHRIIGSDGSLTGYAGGIEKKRFLLNLEREVAGPRDLFSQ